MKQYTQLTYELRYQLYALNKSGIKQTQIALQLGVDQSSISRELKRNKGKRGYRPKQANEKAYFCKKETVKSRVMTAEMIEKITGLLKALWSPEQISGTLKSDINETLSICHETIYKFIWADKENGGELYKFLRRKAKKYTSRCKEKQAGRGLLKIGSVLKNGRV